MKSYNYNGKKIDISLLSYNDFVLDELYGLKTNLLVLTNVFEQLNLDDEMNNANCIGKLVQLSNDLNCYVFALVVTKTLDFSYVSVVVAACGVLIDICDRTHNPFDDGFDNSKKLKIYSVGCTKIGLVIDSDIIINKVVKKIIPECDIVINIAMSEQLLKADLSSILTELEKPYLLVHRQGLTLTNLQ